jgi:DNA-directed RNA polymerase specialized sigma24 family protein
VPAEIAGQRPLLERAAAGDREAFGQLYDAQVEGVYRYLLAWTGDRAAAADLTRQVFNAALSWLPVTAGGEGEAGAWLVAMARDAVAQRRGSGWIAGPAGPAPRARPGHESGAAAGDVLAALARLGDPEREVVVLRLLLGHSLAHAAHLSGYSRRAVLELQLAACLAIWDLTGGARSASPSPPREAVSAEEFERRLGRWEIDLTGSDPGLADALAVAGSLRRAIPGYVVAPELAFVRRLRAELVATAPDGSSPDPDRTPPPARLKAAGSRSWLSRRPWLATSIATAGIVTVLALQAFGNPAPPSTCDGRPCPPPTTVAAAAGGGLATPLSTVGEPSTTTTSTAASSSTATTAVPASAVTAPPATAPATTAARPTTSRPRPTTSRPRPATTRTTTTTAPTTTGQQPTTTTGSPPAPPP